MSKNLFKSKKIQRKFIGYFTSINSSILKIEGKKKDLVRFTVVTKQVHGS